MNEPAPHRWVLIGAVAAGGALGSAARYGLALAWPAAPQGFPYATFVTNVIGCAVLGALLEVLAGHPAPRLLRAFLGTGVLGGFTTFSTYAVENVALARSGHPALATGYAAGTLMAALAAVWAGAWVCRSRSTRRWGRPK